MNSDVAYSISNLSKISLRHTQLYSAAHNDSFQLKGLDTQNQLNAFLSLDLIADSLEHITLDGKRFVTNRKITLSLPAGEHSIEYIRKNSTAVKRIKIKLLPFQHRHIRIPEAAPLHLSLLTYGQHNYGHYLSGTQKNSIG
jgi:hypothetical protein